MNDYAALTTKRAKSAAIADASTIEELDAMWAAWQKQGWSKDGLMYAQILTRKRELGAGLPEGEVERIEAAELNRKHGAGLPPIKGKMA